MELRTEIEIAAPPATVWAVLTDTKAYHEWNPFITTLEGRLEEGAELTVVVSPPDSTDMRFHPLVVRCAQNEELRWRGKMIANFVFAGEHFFQLKPVGDKCTRVVHGENFSGFLVKLLKRQLTQTARGFVFMNQALKLRAEAAEQEHNMTPKVS